MLAIRLVPSVGLWSLVTERDQVLGAPAKPSWTQIHSDEEMVVRFEVHNANARLCSARGDIRDSVRASGCNPYACMYRMMFAQSRELRYIEQCY